jgi:hypothetical protein
MILDKNLTFMQAGDAAAATTKAIPLGAADMTGDTTGMGPYSGLFLHVAAVAATTYGTPLVVTLQTCDTEAGTFEDVQSYGGVSATTAGQPIVKAPVPFDVKNWVRLKFSEAVTVNAHLAADVRKPYKRKP